MNIFHVFVVRRVHTVVELRVTVGLLCYVSAVTSGLQKLFQVYFCCSAILQGPAFHHLSLPYFDIYYDFQHLFAVVPF
jgi:hypothetical protein